VTPTPNSNIKPRRARPCPKGKHDIAMSQWGKSVKERSELFKEEFTRFPPQILNPGH